MVYGKLIVQGALQPFRLVPILGQVTCSRKALAKLDALDFLLLAGPRALAGHENVFTNVDEQQS